ncbi:MAG: DNA-3-methyladenine glycosylase [Bacillota bacterium]
MIPLPREFYLVDALTLAKRLLGKVLVHRTAEGETAGIIVETEAYMGPEDRAAHTWKGRRTPRTQVWYGPGGYAYVYFVYGMHCCFNVVANYPDIPHAVLVRALDPIVGLDLMARRLGVTPHRRMCSGPARLCKAMGIGLSHNGVDLCGSKLFIAELGAPTVGPEAIAAAPRVGIDYAGEAREYLWRFFLADNPCVTRPPRSTSAPGRSRHVLPEASR